jgi:hypothetical protein
MDYARFNYVAQPEDGVTNFPLEIMTNGLSNGVILISLRKQLKKKKES